MKDRDLQHLYIISIQKTSDELIDIWQTNHHLDWSEMSSNMIREILFERLGELSLQHGAINEATSTDSQEKELT